MHAVSVAAVAKALARSIKMSPDEAEMLFVGGLLHDIGKLLLVGYFNESGVSTGLHASVCDYERGKIGIDHAEAGALVAAKWNLATEIQEVIRGHHEGTAEGGPRVAVVRLADAVAHEVGTGYEPGHAPAATAQPADLLALGLTNETWTPLRDQMAVAMDDAVTAMGKLSG